MTLQDLRYLVALVDHAHFGRAAEACDISQPTLSTQIKKLEEQLGVALFERTNKSVRVTAVGEEVAGRARQILADVDAIIGAGRRVSGPLAGTLGLGVIPTLGPYLLPWLVPALRHDYPELRPAGGRGRAPHRPRLAPLLPEGEGPASAGPHPARSPAAGRPPHLTGASDRTIGPLDHVHSDNQLYNRANRA